MEQFDKPQEKTLLQDLEEQINFLDQETDKLEKRNRTCCEQAQYETLMDIQASLEIIKNNHTERLYKDHNTGS